MPKSNKPKIELALNEWQSEFERLSGESRNEGYTTAELSERWGVGTLATRARLKEAQRMGWLCVTRGMRYAIDGRQLPVPLYSFRRPSKASKRG